MRPQSIHQWRQCDCLSITLNYYNENVGFFEPQMHYLGKDGTGKTVSDCPIIYYSVAKLWKVFGYHEFIYRLVVLTLCFLGLVALMKTIEKILNDSFIAIFISLLMYTSAILVYYSNNFLMNVPSFSLALIAIFFFYRFYETERSLFLWISMLFYLLGGLLKIPALTSFIAILGAFVVESFGLVKLNNGKRLFSKPAKQILPFLVVIAVIIAWYNYAYLYNQKYNSGIFLIGTLAIWDLSYERISTIIEHAWILWFDSYHSPYIQYILVLLVIILFVFRKKINKLLLLLTAFLAIGFILFILLWFSVFDQHDYYLINQLIFMIAILLTFFHFIRKHHKKIFTNGWFRIALLLILFQNVFHCRNIIDMRYNSWPNDWHKSQFQALETITPFLDSIGVKHNDKVLFMNDGSFNIPLYLMERKGYTAYWSTSEDVVKERANQVDYVITNDTSTLKREEISSFIDQRVGTYKNISIYSLRKE
ncbi:MAG: hypothetical protein HC831_09520 [Chloroflexia bacterium]|nr:hypothetical protein [Chloroflexia bacterium]